MIGDGRVIDEIVADFRGRRGVAAPDAGRTHDANAGARCALQILKQFFAAKHRASEGVADADGQRRNVRLAFLHDVEMRVEGRGLEHFGESELHLVGESGKMRGRDLAISVLDQVQIFDQQIAPPRLVAEQLLDLMAGDRIDLAPLGRSLCALPSLAGMLEFANLVNVVVAAHGNVAFSSKSR